MWFGDSQWHSGDDRQSPAQQTVATLDRQVQNLRNEHVTLLDNAGELRLYVEGIQHRNFAGDTDGCDTGDIPAIQELTAEMLKRLQEHEEKETKLLMEVYSRDVGVGD